MHETVRTTWTSTLTDCASVHAALSQVTDTDHSTLQHVEVGATRMRRDYEDLCNLKSHLLQYSPFRFADSMRLIHVSSGISSTTEDELNGCAAEEVGLRILGEWDNQPYGAVKPWKADRVKTMALLLSGCSSGSMNISLDPTTLFHQLVLVGERTDTVCDCFAHELTPYPRRMVTQQSRQNYEHLRFTTGSS